MTYLPAWERLAVEYDSTNSKGFRFWSFPFEKAGRLSGMSFSPDLSNMKMAIAANDSRSAGDCWVPVNWEPLCAEKVAG